MVFIKGCIPWNKGIKTGINTWKGKKFSKEHRKKLSFAKKGKKLSKEHKANIGKANSVSMIGRRLSEKTKKKISESHSGEKHPNWKGGISLQYKLKKKNPNVPKKPKYCEICGSTKKISFDHDHDTDKFRGWICHNCNVVIGFANNDIDILKKIIKYLIRIQVKRLNNSISRKNWNKH